DAAGISACLEDRGGVGGGSVGNGQGDVVGFGGQAIGQGGRGGTGGSRVIGHAGAGALGALGGQAGGVVHGVGVAVGRLTDRGVHQRARFDRELGVGAVAAHGEVAAEAAGRAGKGLVHGAVGLGQFAQADRAADG